VLSTLIIVLTVVSSFSTKEIIERCILQQQPKIKLASIQPFYLYLSEKTKEKQPKSRKNHAAERFFIFVVVDKFGFPCVLLHV